MESKEEVCRKFFRLKDSFVGEKLDEQRMIVLLEIMADIRDLLSRNLDKKNGK